jgi:hypothetical protein
VRTAACLCLFIVLFGCTPSPAPTAAASPATSSSSARTTGPVISPPPITPPTPPGTKLPAFACADVTGGSPGIANVTAVRVRQEGTFDRFVLQFDSSVPLYTVKQQAKPVFTQSPSGQSITLSGTAGALIQVHTASQGATYSGTTDFTQANFAVLKEAHVIEDFEGYVAWGLGLGSPACLRVFTLSDPPRLVIDFTNS